MLLDIARFSGDAKAILQNGHHRTTLAEFVAEEGSILVRAGQTSEVDPGAPDLIDSSEATEAKKAAKKVENPLRGASSTSG